MTPRKLYNFYIDPELADGLKGPQGEDRSTRSRINQAGTVGVSEKARSHAKDGAPAGDHPQTLLTVNSGTGTVRDSPYGTAAVRPPNRRPEGPQQGDSETNHEEEREEYPETRVDRTLVLCLRNTGLPDRRGGGFNPPHYGPPGRRGHGRRRMASHDGSRRVGGQPKGVTDIRWNRREKPKVAQSANPSEAGRQAEICDEKRLVYFANVGRVTVDDSMFRKGNDDDYD